MNLLARVLNVMVPVFIGVCGQIFLKLGMSAVGPLKTQPVWQYFFKAFLNWQVLCGFSLYFLSSLFWMLVLSKEDLSFAYPLLSVGYVLILLFSFLIFKEHVSFVRWFGVLVIIFGVILISRS
jgi:multidrug transporter EmrE-like cation transporter